MGRDKAIVTEADFVREPDETMMALAHIKNNESLSWRQLTREYLPEYSHAYVRKVALGEAQSDAISIALGIQPEPPETRPVEVCPDCGKVHKRLKTCDHERQRKTKRYRLCYECGRGESGRERDAQIRDEMRAAGCDSFTEWVDAMRVELKIRRGICPDCGNDSCMADGVHGLWCPNCDASYLLEVNDG